ncbi:ABC transporter ATP-binding protein [Granulicatella balaenopterae]|nr:ATP-binding cassette domain-containing protein [Granulicatella balaenopterae]
MLEIKNLKKVLGNHVLFDDFNLSVEKGEYITFSGVSGSGKTTLLNMIGSLEAFDEGQIIVDGLDISNKKNQQKYLGEKVGFVFQNFALLENKTVRENLALIKPKFRTNVSIEEAIASVGLTDKLDALVYTLSGGEQQRVSIARLMVKKCELILCDEPTGSLDKNNAENVMRMLKELNQSGKTILLVTHDEKYITQGGRVVHL